MTRRSGDFTRAELGEFTRAEPPAFLDALVKERVGAVLAQRRAESAPAPDLGVPRQAGAARGGDPAARGAARGVAPGRIGSAEAWAYAFGFLAYGAQVADGVARLIWRAVAG